MTTAPTTAILIAATAALMLGCKADTSGLVTLTVPELTARLGRSLAPILCDANSDETRKRFGVIPGATLLTNYRDYDPADELPADPSHPLVFYCHSARCGAAVDAARKAVAAGFSNVSVLPDGITGWADAGHPVATPSAP